MVIQTYVKECGDGDCHCLFVTSSGHRDLCQGVWGWRLSLFVCDTLVVIQTYVKECGDGDCHCLFVTSSGHRDLCQGVWGWRLSLFVCDL